MPKPGPAEPRVFTSPAEAFTSLENLSNSIGDKTTSTDGRATKNGLLL